MLMKRFSTFFLSALIVLLALPLTASAEEAVAPAKGNVVISKIYYNKTKKLTSGNYQNSGYVEIYNNSDKAVNVAGLKLGVVECDAKANAWYSSRLTEEGFADKVVIRQVFQIPGTEKILAPGATLLLVNSAINHTTIGKYDCDLSGADYEAKGQTNYENNADVPALEQPYSYIAAQKIMMFTQTGANPFVLFMTDANFTELPTVHQYDATKEGHQKTTGNTNILIDKSWVIDGVDIINTNDDETGKRLWADIDAGYHKPGAGYAGVRIYRKIAKVEADGRLVLADTDNTSADFYASHTVQVRNYFETFDFANNNGEWTPCTIDNMVTYTFDPIILGDVTLSGVKGEAMQPVRYWDNDDKYLQANVGSRLRFKAAEGRAIRQIVPIMRNDQYTFSVDATAGAVANDVWTGNATEVELIIKGANQSFKSFAVITADADDNTVTPAPVIDVDVNAATIAEFKAAENGKVVKLTLTNARVNGVTYDGCYVEDATGAIFVKGATLIAGTQLNGYIIGTKTIEEQVNYTDDTEKINQFTLTALDADHFEASEATMTGTVMALPAIATEENHGRLITVENVTTSVTGKNVTLTDGDGKTFKARDYLGNLPADYTWPTTVKSLTAVAVFYSTGWVLMPISAAAIVDGSEAVALFDFENNNLNLTFGKNGTVDEQNAGNLLGQALVAGEVTLNCYNGSTMPTRFYKVNDAAKSQLQATKDAQLRFTAADGRAITKIVITPTTATNNKWAVDGNVGELSTDKLTWTGNAESVRFTVDGSFFQLQIEVTTNAKNDATQVAVRDEYTTEINSLKDFKDLANGTKVKLNLNNAIITSGMYNKWGYYIQDATAGANIYCTGLDFNNNDIVNGSINVIKATQQMGARIAMTEDTNAAGLTVTANGTVEPVAATVAELLEFTEVVKNAEAKDIWWDSDNLNKVVKLTNVAVKGTAATTATITDNADNTKTIGISNPAATTSPYVITDDLSTIDYPKATVVGILYHTTENNGSVHLNKLYPLSITQESSDGIANVNAAKTANTVIYNLQGVRMNQLQRGLNIVNGNKVVVK